MAEKKSFEFSYILYDHYLELDEEIVQLVESAIEASKKAYAPYSKFNVGASIRLDSGKVLQGNNQENIAFPSGLCAERTVLFYAGANYPDNKVTHLAIYAKGDLVDVEEPISPCGGCRQVIAEVIKRQNETFQLILCGRNGQTIVLDDALMVLPFPFGMDE
jgi:cytidine deaminase